VDLKRQHNEEFYDVSCTKNTVFCRDQIKSRMGMWQAWGKKRCIEDVVGNLTDRGLYTGSWSDLMIWRRCSLNIIINLMQLLCAFVGLNYSKKQNCYDLDRFIRPEYVTDFITSVDFLIPSAYVQC